MIDRRLEPRLLCADIVALTYKDKGGRTRKINVNLEDISLSGACLQVEAALPLGTQVRIAYDKGELSGFVKYCVFREIGYFLGVEFDADSRWSQKHFKPQHLLDPRRLVLRTINRVTRTTAQSVSTQVH